MDRNFFIDVLRYTRKYTCTKKEAIKKKEMDLQHLSDFIKAMNYEQNPMND